MAVNFASAYTVSRYGVSAYGSDGVWVDVAATSVTINANIQPVSVGAGKGSAQIMQMINALGLERVDGLIAIRSNEALYTARKATGQKADRLTYRGDTYEIISVSYRGTLAALAHYIAVAQLIDEKTLEPTL